jgi:ribosomal protein S12 methylthiotransferase accessory factor
VSATGIEEALTRLSRVVGDRFGIVRTVALPRLDAGDPPVRIAESHPARLIGQEAGAAVNEGGGAGLRRETAMVKAIAETVERYCAAFPGGERRSACWQELDGDAIAPHELALFSAEQHREPRFPFEPFGPRTRVQWVRAHSLAGGDPCWVPAALVFLPHRREAGEAAIIASISTGLAAGPSLATATASGLLEAVERDAFMLTWRHRLPTPMIDLERLGPGEEAALVAALRSTGMSCRARLITQDLELPVITIMLGARSPAHPVVVVGAGAAAQPRRALRLALEEACLSLFGINRLVRTLGSEVSTLAPAEMRSLALQSTAFATRPELAAAAPFFFGEESADTVTLSELEQRFAALASGSLDRLLVALGRWGKRAVVVDCTTADIREIGFRVVRVVVPGLRPLDHDSAAPHLGGERWLDAPIDAGPHPFP